MNDEQATGAELYELWRTANILFPKAAVAYVETCEVLGTVSGTRDEETLGKASPWWSALAQELELCLYHSSQSLNAASEAMNSAINEFAFVDEGNAVDVSETTEGLTDGGRGLKERVGDQNPYTEDHPYPSDYDRPGGVDKPEDWQDVRDTRKAFELIRDIAEDILDEAS